jgi:methyltransferase
MPEGLLLLGLIALQRLSELWLARRHTAALMAKGAIEYGAGHYPLMVAFHTAWLLGMLALAWDRPVSLPWLGVVLVLQVARYWIIATLGERWTTRIIILPGAPPVRAGPFRLMRHPNYAVVAAEIAAVPLALGLPVFAAVFFTLNLPILAIRIRAEDKALRWAKNPSLAKLQRRL